MAFERIFDIATLIVVVAIIIALVTHKETAIIVQSLANAFATSIRAALGNPQ